MRTTITTFLLLAILWPAPVAAEESAPAEDGELQLVLVQIAYQPSTGAAQLQLVASPHSEADLEQLPVIEKFSLSRFSVVQRQVAERAGVSALSIVLQSSEPDPVQDLEQLLGVIEGVTAVVELPEEGGTIRVLFTHGDAVSFPGQYSSGKVETQPDDGTTTLTFDLASDVIQLTASMQAGLLDSKAEQEYQHDADIFRMRHLLHYGKLIEEFKAKTGRYPLEGASELDTLVFFATPEQQTQLLGGPDYSHTTAPQEAFREELEKELGRKIELRFDPQRVMVEAPVYYIYLVRKDEYYFAIHLNIPRSFTRPIAKTYHKVEITTSSSERKGVWTFEELQADEGFKKAIAEEPAKAGFFMKLQEEHK